MTMEKAMITFYWSPQTRAARIMWLLEELGEPFHIHEIDIRDEASRSDPGFQAASPMGKVPAISVGEVAMADSAAIALYLADRFPAAGLAPGIDHPLRGRYLYWMTYTPGVIEPAMMEQFRGLEPNRVSAGWGTFDLMIETLEAGLGESPWILGDRFSAADVMLGSSVNFMSQFGLLPDMSDTLSGYVERCLARPGYQRALAREPAPQQSG
jgi:glutathione S-transferase